MIGSEKVIVFQLIGPLLENHLLSECHLLNNPQSLPPGSRKESLKLTNPIAASSVQTKCNILRACHGQHRFQDWNRILVAVIIGTQPDPNAASLSVYRAHQLHLFRPLRQVCLVDANGVDPENPRTDLVTQSFQCIPCAECNLERPAIEKNVIHRCWVTPCVG